ncbi:MAG: LysR substrate-binding domain-containing protein, partial [Proteobacteria bacterium]|nr:LysR substrate-binding domain-containing protein [Pseudomonadota bacterium]
ADLQVRVAGPEVLLAKVAPIIIAQIRKTKPKAKFIFLGRGEAEAERLVRNNEVHFALTTSEVPSDLSSKKLFDTIFSTVVGHEHPLYKFAKAGKIVPVADVLQYPFVSIDAPILGGTGKSQSLDGWRDDKFPRRIDFVVSSLRLLEELVENATAIAYLPAYFAEQIEVGVLKISNCPYSCKQTVRLFCRDHKQAGWMSQLF